MHGPKTAVLPRHPLLTFRQFGIAGERELVLRIEMACQIRHDGLTFHDSEAAIVVVDEDGNATIGTLLGEPRFLLDVLADVD